MINDLVGQTIQGGNDLWWERFLEKVQEGDSPANEKATKYDKKKLKIPLLIFGAGTHSVYSRRMRLMYSAPVDVLQPMRS